MTTPLTTSGGQPAQVSVSVERASVQADPPRWHLEYSVRHTGNAPAWLVVDESLTYQCSGTAIELSYAREKLQPGVHSFGYFDPKIIALPPGGQWQQSLEVSWPCQLSDLWNTAREASPPPGDYDVSIRIGYGLTAAPEPSRVGENVEASVLRWQHTAASPAVRLSVPPYAGGNGLLTP